MPAASTFLARKRVLPIARSSAEWELVDAQLKERSFFMAGVARAQTLQLFRNLATQVAAGKMTPQEARVTIRQGLADLGYSPEEAGVKAGSIKDLSSYRRIMLVLDTNVRMSAGWMQHCQDLVNPAVGGQELFRLYARRVPRDWRQRWLDAAQQVNWQGVAPHTLFIATLDSPIWPALSRFGNPYPPFDFNSGMSTRPVPRQRCIELGLEPPPPPDNLPSPNESVKVSVANLDADLVESLTLSLGVLAERQGDSLVMTDLNGSRPYPLNTLKKLFDGALPPGVPNTQAKAFFLWGLDPDSFLPGGKNANLLKTLSYFADRLGGDVPPKLAKFLEATKTDAKDDKFTEDKRQQLNEYRAIRSDVKKDILSSFDDENSQVQIYSSNPSASSNGNPTKSFPLRISRSSYGEMLGNKALTTSIIEGVSPEIHIEAVKNLMKILDDSYVTGEANPTKRNENIETIIKISAPFTASDGNEYVVHLTAHRPKTLHKGEAPIPKLYFLSLTKK